MDLRALSRVPPDRAGTDLGDDTGSALGEKFPSLAKASSLTSGSVRSLKGRTAAGLSTDMTRRSRDIDIPDTTADERHDTIENVPSSQPQGGSVDRRHRSIPIRGIHRPLDHDDETLRFRRNNKTLSAVGAINGPINQPTPEASMADLKGMRNHSVRQSRAPGIARQVKAKHAVISPPQSSTSSDDGSHPQLPVRRIETLKNVHNTISRASIQRETDRVGRTESAKHAETLLLQAGINPSTFNPEQFETFANQSPAVQLKTIQTYAANLQQQQSQQMGKPIPYANSPPERRGSPYSFYNAEGMAPAPPGAMRGPGGPNATQQAGGSNHALQDYQMQLMLLEQQNKKRLMMERQEQDASGGNNMPVLRRNRDLFQGGPVPVPPAGPYVSREHSHDDSSSEQVDAIDNEMSKVPRPRRKANLPGRGKDADPKDNDPKFTTNATISKDNTMGAEARINELLKNWGSSKMKLVTGPSLPADTDDSDSDSTLGSDGSTLRTLESP